MSTPRFEFRIQSPRWEGKDVYRLNIEENGWHVSHQSYSGSCDKRGVPHLYGNFDQDHLQYPSGLGFEMELLFEHARDKTLHDAEIQARLDRLAKWVEDVTAVERPDFD